MTDSTGTTEHPTLETHRWDIPGYKADAFKAKIDQANRKLARAGLDARFEVIYTAFEVTRPVTNRDRFAIGGHVVEPWVRAELSGPLTLRHGHFTFVARLVPEQAGVTVHSVPGQELGGHVPRGDTACEHCAVDRARTRLYLVRDERDGSIIQLGHSCIELYTGIAPKGLWALTFDQTLDEFTRDDDVEGGRTTHHPSASVEAVLACAYAHSDKGRSYVPTSSLDTPTVAKVRLSLFGRIDLLRERERTYFLEKNAETEEYLADAELLTAIKASVESTSAASDYGRNLRIILAGETVSGANVGVLASLVKVYARQQQLEVERKSAAAVVGFIGEIGERVRDISATAKTVHYSDGTYGTTTFLVAVADDGHTLIWNASKALSIEVGEKFTIAAATVKAHENYRGTDQTVIARPAQFEVRAA